MGAYSSACQPSGCVHECSTLDGAATLSSKTAYLLPLEAAIEPLVCVLIWTGLPDIVPEWRCLLSEKNGLLATMQLPGEGLPMRWNCWDPTGAAAFVLNLSEMPDVVHAIFLVGSVKLGESFRGAACQVSLATEKSPGVIRPCGNFRHPRLKDGSGLIMISVFRSVERHESKWWVQSVGTVYHIWDSTHPFQSLAEMIPNWTEQFCHPPRFSKMTPPPELHVGNAIELSQVHLTVATAHHDLMMNQMEATRPDMMKRRKDRRQPPGLLSGATTDAGSAGKDGDAGSAAHAAQVVPEILASKHT